MNRATVSQRDIDSGNARTFGEWKTANRVVVKGQRARVAPNGKLVFALSQTKAYDPFACFINRKHDGYEGREHGDIMDGPGNPCDYGDA